MHEVISKANVIRNDLNARWTGQSFLNPCSYDVVKAAGCGQSLAAPRKAMKAHPSTKVTSFVICPMFEKCV